MVLQSCRPTIARDPEILISGSQDPRLLIQVLLFHVGVGWTGVEENSEILVPRPALSTPVSLVFWQMGWQPIVFAGKNAGELLPRGQLPSRKTPHRVTLVGRPFIRGGPPPGGGTPLPRGPQKGVRTEKVFGQI